MRSARRRRGHVGNGRPIEAARGWACKSVRSVAQGEESDRSFQPARRHEKVMAPRTGSWRHVVGIRFILSDKTESVAHGDPGASLMSIAKSNGISGVEAECGGSLSCGTCHIYVEPKWLDLIPAPSLAESEMLDFVAAERRPSSRLSCQIRMTQDLDGMTVEVPDTQN